MNTLNHTLNHALTLTHSCVTLLSTTVANVYRYMGRKSFRAARFAYAEGKRISVNLAVNPKVPFPVWRAWFRAYRCIGRNAFTIGRDLYACANALAPRPKKLTKRQEARYRANIARTFNAPGFAYSSDVNILVYRTP